MRGQIAVSLPPNSMGDEAFTTCFYAFSFNGLGFSGVAQDLVLVRPEKHPRLERTGGPWNRRPDPVGRALPARLSEARPDHASVPGQDRYRGGARGDRAASQRVDRHRHTEGSRVVTRQIDTAILEAMGLPVPERHVAGDGPRMPSLGAIASRETIHFYLMAFARRNHFPLVASGQKSGSEVIIPRPICGPMSRAIGPSQQSIGGLANTSQLAKETGGEGWDDPDPGRTFTPSEQKRLAIRFGLVPLAPGKSAPQKSQEDRAQAMSRMGRRRAGNDYGGTSGVVRTLARANLRCQSRRSRFRISERLPPPARVSRPGGVGGTDTSPLLRPGGPSCVCVSFRPRHCVVPGCSSPVATALPVEVMVPGRRTAGAEQRNLPKQECRHGRGRARRAEAAQTALINAKPGDVIELGEGRFEFNSTLSLDVSHVTLRGKGPDKTILSFKNQGAGTGGEGLLVTSKDDVTIADLAIEDARGDGIKINGTKRIIFRNVRTEWTGGPKETNGGYGIYPVLCTDVLIEGCKVSGASDAGIYVGQSTNIIVRRNTVEKNVAGIEIENCTKADVYENVATDNSGGILVFTMPDLPTKDGRVCRVFQQQGASRTTTRISPPRETSSRRSRRAPAS